MPTGYGLEMNGTQLECFYMESATTVELKHNLTRELEAQGVRTESVATKKWERMNFLPPPLLCEGVPTSFRFMATECQVLYG